MLVSSNNTSPMKYFFVLIVYLFCCDQTARSQGFQNSLHAVKGGVTLVKELSNGEILATIYDINLDSTRIVKLRSNGELYISKTLGVLTDNLRFDHIYEYNDGYAFSFGKSRQFFTTTNDPFSEGFMFFDSNLVFKYQTEFLIHDTAFLRHEIYYDMSDHHVWSGMFHYVQPDGYHSYFLKIFRFNPDGSFADSTSVLVDSLFIHRKFIRSFLEDSVYKVIVGYNNQLHTYSFSPNLALTGHDSTSGFKFVNNADSFDVILNDSGHDDILKMGNQYITTNKAVNNSQGKVQLVVSKFVVNINYRNMLIPLPNNTHSYDLSWYNNRIAYKMDKIFIAADYSDSTIEYNYLAYIHQLDADLNVVRTVQIFNNIDKGVIEALVATEDGGCLIVGRVWAPFSDITIYMVKLDSNGVLAFVKPISKELNNAVLYPNPGKNVVFGIPEMATISFTDLMGQQVTLPSGSHGTDVSILHPGIYFYKVFSNLGEYVSSGKWIKE
jgi:hypothetical protein